MSAAAFPSDPPTPAAGPGAPAAAGTAAALLERVRAVSPSGPPGPPGPWAKLASGDPAPADWLRAAQACHAAWLKGGAGADPVHGRLFADLALAAWQSLPPADRPACGLGAPLVRALAELDDGPALGALAQEVAAAATHPGRLGAPPAEQLVAALLRHLRQRRDWPALARLLAALRPVWHACAGWQAPALGAVSALARHADDLAPLRLAAMWVEPLCALAHAAGDTPADDPAQRLGRWNEVGRLALRTLQVGAMQQAADALLAHGGLAAEDSTALLVQLLATLGSLAPDDTTRALLARAGAHGHHAGLRLSMAKLAHADGAEVPQLRELLGPLDLDEPGAATAMGWLAGICFHQGHEREAIGLYRALESRRALSAIDRLRLGHLRSREESGFLPTHPAAPEPAADTAHATATDSDLAEARAQRSARDTWPEDLLAPFGAALAPLRALLSVAPTHDSRYDAAALAAAGQAALHDFTAGLQAAPPASLQACLRLARHLSQLADAAFGHHARWPEAFGMAFGPAYGRLDPQRCRAQHRTVQRHVVALCSHAIERPRALQGGAGVASLRHVEQLEAQRAEARWALGEADAALDDLARLDAQLGPLAAEPRARLRLRAWLTAGRLDAARAALASPQDELLPLREWDAWLAAESASARLLVADRPCEGHFESVGPDGACRRHAHRLAPTALSLSRHAGLGVRNSHLLIGRQGGILRPADWHLSMGEYPYDHRHVRARGGAGARAAVLGAPRWRTVDRPALVLANLDATFHRNFYHWVVLLLSRIDALHRAGLFSAERPLWLPAELSGWMRSSLVDISVPDSALCSYGEDEDLWLTDAWVASPLEFASPALLDGLRRTLLGAAGCDADAPAPAGGALLYISRRGEGRRPLVEEAALESLAESLGFTLVAPETLSLLDQVRLFASARGIAGPPGAAYTNLLWAGRGARVLSIFKEEANLPTFVDLSLVRGQAHRWLLGRNLPGYELMSVVNAPYSVDMALAEAQLHWVAGAGTEAVE
ncbi:glycosyltransferase 61 family protein [Ideonella sp.]|uniref:glycosyltransferase family 61 protein n=1 Tax=Ideonella sp. TaxID=1929293 RepID=UPI0035ADFB29